MSKFIFIVGFPRSGTSFLLDLLAQHPEITHLSPEMVGVDRDGWESALLFNYSTEECIDILENLGNGVYVEKTPDHIFKASQIKKMPNSYMFSIIRNKKDAVNSALKADFIDKTEEELHKQYKNVQNIIEEEGINKIDYRDLIMHPNRVANKIFDKIGVKAHRIEKRRVEPIEGF
jgi:LPS sulfotransferase NodH